MSQTISKESKADLDLAVANGSKVPHNRHLPAIIPFDWCSGPPVGFRNSDLDRLGWCPFGPGDQLDCWVVALAA